MQKNNKHERKETNIIKPYWLYGIHAVRAALLNNRREIKRIIATSPNIQKMAVDFALRKIAAEVMSPQAISHLLPEGAVHQGIAIEVKPLPEISLEEYFQTGDLNKPLLILDQVTDPHNVGAIIRTTAAFDVGAVIVTKDHAPQESAVLAKASSGGIEIVPIVTITNLAQTMELLKKNGFWCVGLDGEAKQTIAQAKLNNKTALILGAEGKGMRRLTTERCDMVVRLPISPQMESLNVSNAAAIAIYSIFNS
jgi:23S rRNA (guanosine2251-2'-O)-methyltransferase